MTTPGAVRGALLSVAILASAAVTGPALAAGVPVPSAALLSPPAELISTNPVQGPPLFDIDVFTRPSISGDGSVVAYAELLANFSTGVTTYVGWVRDRAAAAPAPIPYTLGNVFNPVVSRDGCHVAFWADGGLPGLYTWNRCNGSNPNRISIAQHNPRDFANASRRDVAVSADGRFVAAITGIGQNQAVRFDNGAPAGTAPVGTFVYIRSIDISDDGSLIAISAAKTDNRFPAQIMVWPTSATNMDTISPPVPGSNSDDPSVSQDGRFVAYTSVAVNATTFQFTQLFVRDRATGVNHHITVSPPTDGQYADPDILPSGSQLAFAYEEGGDEPPGFRRAPGLLHRNEVFVAVSTAGAFDSITTEPVSFGVNDQLVSQGAIQPAISATGRFVAFASGSDAEFGPFPTNNSRIDVWLRQRVPSLTIAPAVLDFGTLVVGATSGPLNAVVTNTSRVLVPIAAVTPPAPPFALAGDTCSGAVLLPGQICVLTVMFSPTTATASTGQVAATGEGITVASQLRGTGSTTPPPPTLPPPTTAPGPTTTTQPGALAIAPPAVDFGTVNSGDTTPTQDLTVTNVGGAPVKITNGALGGDGADQFAFDFTNCSGKTLAPTATCTVPVATTPTRGGASEATFTISGTGNTSASSTLKVIGTFTPTLLMKPGVLHPGQVGTIVGAGFPPSVAVQLAFEGEGPFVTVNSDAGGALTLPFVVLRNGRRIGGQVLVAVDQPGLFTGARTTFLVEPATFSPSGSISPAVTNGVRAMVSRNG